jgi:hypothetical protein
MRSPAGVFAGLLIARWCGFSTRLAFGAGRRRGAAARVEHGIDELDDRALIRAIHHHFLL